MCRTSRRYDREIVDGWVNRYAEHIHSPLYDFVFGHIARLLAGSYSSNLEPDRPTVGDEATLFRLAAQLEQARPEKDRFAPL